MENTLKIIDAVGKQWPFLIVVFIIFIFIIKWKSIWTFIENVSLIRIKRGDTELELNRDEKEKNNYEDEIKDQINESIITLENKNETKQVEDIDEKYDIALKDRKFDEAKKIFEKKLESESDDIKKRKLKINNYFWRHLHGDIKAFDEFEEYIKNVDENKELIALINSTLSKFYYDSGDKQKSIDLLLKAIEQSDDESEKASFVSRVAEYYYYDEEKEKSFEILNYHLPKFQNRSAKFKIYIEIAFLYKNEKKKLFESLAYQKAMECRPNDTSTLFDVAYNFSETKENNSDISLLIYRKLLRINPNHENSLNNIGVAFKKLEMPFKSVDYYKKAFEVNSTVAASNLAYLLIDKGFNEEAEKYLIQAQQQEDVHDNVYSACSKLKEKLSKENDLETKIIANAKKKYSFFSIYGQSVFSYNKISIADSNNWIFDNNDVLIKLNDKNIEITWKDNYKITGTRINNSFNLTYNKPNEIDKYIGYGYIKNSSKIICGFEIEKEFNEFIFCCEK